MVRVGVRSRFRVGVRVLIRVIIRVGVGVRFMVVIRVNVRVVVVVGVGIGVIGRDRLGS